MSDEIDALIERLRAAETAYVEATAAVEAIEGEEVPAVPEHLRRFESILDAYEDRATGSGDFGGYLEFRSEITSFVTELPADQAGRAAFEDAADHLEEKRLQPRHFDRARAALDPAREIVDALDTRQDAAAELQAARSAATDRVAEVTDRINRLEQAARFSDVDVDASLDPIQDPIDTYNRAVTDAFDTFRRERPAIDVIELFALSDRYPLVPMPAPPERLLVAMREGVGADLTIPELLEYATYSRSKLQHYVDDPSRLTDAVAEDRLYLERLSAEPFTVAWPPPPAAELRWQLRELESVIDRFAADDTCSALRSVWTRVRDAEQFDQLRTVAIARTTLDDADRRRLANGELTADLEAAGAARDRLRSVLADVPVPGID